MPTRPDIETALEPGETLLWQGFPAPGRPVSPRANAIAAGLFAVTLILLVTGWFLAIYRPGTPALKLIVYVLIATSAFLTYSGLRLTLLDRRRARARDARTAHAITDRRALTLSGPYRAEVVLGPDVTAEAQGTSLVITGPAGRLTFERLDDATRPRDIIRAQIGGAP